VSEQIITALREKFDRLAAEIAESIEAALVSRDDHIRDLEGELDRQTKRADDAEARLKHVDAMVDAGGVVANAKATERALAAEAESRLERKHTDSYIRRLHGAEAQVARLREALEQISGVGSDGQRCWCYAGARNTEHDEGCEMMRAALDAREKRTE
jgi:hypothetical protein